MAIVRDHPYAGFNFLVSLDGTDPSSPAGGFAEVTGLGRRLQVLTYRAGNDRTLAPRLATGLALPVRVVLRRGIIGHLGLWSWLREALQGGAPRRKLVIDLLTEDRADVAQRWVLTNALPVALEGPNLNAMANEVAIESLEIVAESLEIE